MAKTSAVDHEPVPRASLDRPTILGAALRLVDCHGLGALNMRRLARELGVGTMSLYHHVAHKDALLDGIVELVLSEIEIPPDTDDWEQQVGMMARSFRATALRHPHCVPLLVGRPFTSPGALRPVEAAFQVLAAAGLGPEEVIVAHHTLVAYVLGFVTMESAGLLGSACHDRDPEDLRSEGFPHLAALTPHLAGRDAALDFDAGLRVLEAGVRQAISR